MFDFKRENKDTLILFFVDFFINFGEDEIKCKDILDLLNLMFTI